MKCSLQQRAENAETNAVHACKSIYRASLPSNVLTGGSTVPSYSGSLGSSPNATFPIHGLGAISCLVHLERYSGVCEPVELSSCFCVETYQAQCCGYSYRLRLLLVGTSMSPIFEFTLHAICCRVCNVCLA